ncbi:MAG TPA: hypothetical protein VNO50_16095 [Pyrinomonadaceae bacterium]|nr:hypothetical protein [Pyrinomonadaceae bacterium]
MSAIKHLMDANQRYNLERSGESEPLMFDSQVGLPGEGESESLSETDVSHSTGELTESVSPG